MSWSEIKKAVNSDLSTPLNTLINNRPKGYKLQLDSYENVKLNGVTKTYTSATGGLVRMWTNKAMTAYNYSINIDGVSAFNVIGTSSLVSSGFVSDNAGNTNLTYEIEFGNSFQIIGYTNVGASDMMIIAVYKYVPIT